MNIEKTENIESGDGIVMVVYGGPKSGKTTFATSTSKHGKTLLIDFENGGKYLGERGINVDILRMNDWFSEKEVKDLKEVIKDYEFIIIDPVGEAMDFLITGQMVRGSKMRQQDGSLTMAGWGEVKNRMRGFIKWLRSTGKNVILVFHDERYKFENELYHSLMIATKLKDVIPGMVEIISYLGIQKDENGLPKRILYTPAQGGTFDSGDRTGRVPKKVEISEFDGWSDFLNSLKSKKSLLPEDNKSPAEEKLEEVQKVIEEALEGDVIDIELSNNEQAEDVKN